MVPGNPRVLALKLRFKRRNLFAELRLHALLISLKRFHAVLKELLLPVIKLIRCIFKFFADPRYLGKDISELEIKCC